MSDMPEVEKICKARYGYDLHIYGTSDGKTIVQAKDKVVIKAILKQDAPYEVLDSGAVTFPVLRVVITVDKDQHIQMMNYREDLSVSLSMVVYDEQRSNENIISEKDAIVEERILFSNIFQALIETPEDVTLSITENPTITENEDGTYNADPSVAQQLKDITLNLSCIAHRNRFKNAVNLNALKPGAGKNVRPFDVLAYGISFFVKEKDSVILQNPDNDNKEMQVTVPPWNLRDFCSFMQTVYGIYSTGLLIYQDLKYLYVIPKYSNKYAVPKDEFDKVHIFVVPPNQVYPNTIGYYKDSDGSRYIVTCGGPECFTPINTAEALKELQGSIIKVFASQYAEGSVTFDDEKWGGSPAMPQFNTGIKGSNPDAKDKVRYFHNELSNNYLLDEYILNLQFSQRAIVMQLSDADYTIFTFNRSYKITFLMDPIVEAEYGGDYKLYDARHAISAQENEPMSSMSVLTFHKAI